MKNILKNNYKNIKLSTSGFTLIELITTFALSSVLIILLINIILIIKNIYSNNDIKSQLIIEQSNLSHMINKSFGINNLNSYTPCADSDFCYNFNFVDGSTSKLVVYDDSITFDNYTYKLIEGTDTLNPTMEIINVDVSNTDVNNSILVIKIPIIHKLYPNQDYGFNIVYQYNSNKITL